MTNSAITPEIIAGEGYASDVILPASFADFPGLNATRLRLAKNCVKVINENYIESGRLFIESCRELFELKQLLLHQEWGAFLKSGALPLNERKVNDMCTAWDKWLSRGDFTDGELVGLGTRTMAKIALLPPAEQEEAEKLVKEGRMKEARQKVEKKKAETDKAIDTAKEEFNAADAEAKESLFATHFEKSYRTEERIASKNTIIEDLKGRIEAKDKQIAKLEERLQKAVVSGEWDLQAYAVNRNAKASQAASA